MHVHGLFREAVLALWAADHADHKFRRALIRVIQAGRLLALVADERVLFLFRTDVLPSVVLSERVEGRLSVGSSQRSD